MARCCWASVHPELWDSASAVITTSLPQETVLSYLQTLPVTCQATQRYPKRRMAKEPEDSRLACQEQCLLCSLITVRVPAPIPSIY
ncbi:rCG52483 [Rattus norvegicus]|uniref:RCG52483 n=1 Tax=Rattus norvegicus TaxID=10116 RepID=A6K0T5_RAT|nr:rCG52483 [Rattus norvegicus]